MALAAARDIQACSLLDVEYQDMLMALRRMEPKHKAATKITAQYFPYYQDFSLQDLDNCNTIMVYWATKILIPFGARPTLQKNLHLPHLGVNLTQKVAST